MKSVISNTESSSSCSMLVLAAMKGGVENKQGTCNARIWKFFVSVNLEIYSWHVLRAPGMPPKKKASEPSKKTQEKKKERVIEVAFCVQSRKIHM